MSEMVGASVRIKVPLTWEGETLTHRKLSGWTDGNRPIYGGDEYIERTLRGIPAFDWFEAGWDVDQPEGWEALEVAWSGQVNFSWEGDEDANNLLSWLREHNIPFIAQSDGVPGDFDGTAEYFNGFSGVDAVSTGMGAAMHQHVWQSFLDNDMWHQQASDVNHYLVRAVDSWFKARSSDMTDWDISHLPADPPPDEEDDEDDH